MTLGTKLYNLRKKKEVTLDKIAFELEISKTAIGKWEADKAKPSIDNLLKICDYFETDIYSLLEDVSNITVHNTKFKGHSYVGYAQSFVVNNTTSPELINSVIENQKKITDLVMQQNELLVKLLNK